MATKYYFPKNIQNVKECGDDFLYRLLSLGR